MAIKSRVKKIEEDIKKAKIDPELAHKAFAWLSKNGFKDMPKELEEVFRKKPLIEWFKDANLKK